MGYYYVGPKNEWWLLRFFPQGLRAYCVCVRVCSGCGRAGSSMVKKWEAGGFERPAARVSQPGIPIQAKQKTEFKKIRKNFNAHLTNKSRTLKAANSKITVKYGARDSSCRSAVWAKLLLYYTVLGLLCLTRIDWLTISDATNQSVKPRHTGRIRIEPFSLPSLFSRNRYSRSRTPWSLIDWIKGQIRPKYKKKKWREKNNLKHQYMSFHD